MSERTWPENVEPTPEQFADWLATLERAELIQVAEMALRNGRMAARCFEANHEGLIEERHYAARAMAQQIDRANRYRLAWLSARRRARGNYGRALGDVLRKWDAATKEKR